MKNLKNSAVATVIAMTLGLTAATASATGIGINFWRNYEPAEPAMPATDIAGVVPQANWNNIGTTLPDSGSPRTNTVANLLDASGGNSGATVFFTAGKIDAPVGHIDDTLGPDYSLMNGYLDTRTSGGITYKPLVTVSSIPYAS